VGHEETFRFAKNIGPKGLVLDNLRVACVKIFFLFCHLVLADNQELFVFPHYMR